MHWIDISCITGSQVARRLMESHVNDSCRMREVKCRNDENCGWKGMSHSSGKHERVECEYRRVFCKHGCKDGILVKDLEKHYEEDIKEHLEMEREGRLRAEKEVNILWTKKVECFFLHAVPLHIGRCLEKMARKREGGPTSHDETAKAE